MLKPESVDAYIAGVPEAARPVMEELRNIIKATIPQVEEKIAYGVPFYKYHGEFVGFAAYTKHVSFGYGSGVLGDDDLKKLAADGYKTGSGTMQIKFEQKVPAAIIKKILKTKAKMNEAAKANK